MTSPLDIMNNLCEEVRTRQGLFKYEIQEQIKLAITIFENELIDICSQMEYLSFMLGFLKVDINDTTVYEITEERFKNVQKDYSELQQAIKKGKDEIK